MLNIKPTYNLRDVSIIPAKVSTIKSRSECNPRYEVFNAMPIFTAPMSAVVNIENANVWEYNDIKPIIPRNIPFDIRLNEALNNHRWIAVSLSEFKQMFLDDTDITKRINISDNNWSIKVLIDVANGHMQQIYDLCVAAKRKYNDRRIRIMVGNIANPETYEAICNLNDKWDTGIYNSRIIDYVRVGIGSGSCCFINGTNVTMYDNTKKNIEDIQIGDKIISAQGNICNVTNTIHFKSNEDLIRINDITCTTDHEFLVINKTDKDIVTEDTLMDYAYYIPANKLNKNIHLLIKR